MEYKKYLPKILVGLIFLIIIAVFIDVKGSELLPSLLGFVIGGGITFLLIRRITKSRRRS